MNTIKENTYFKGNVKSLGFSQKGDESSVGVMAIGEYTFGTKAPEKMTVVKGALTVKLPNTEKWQTFVAGESFDVIGNSSFDLRVETATAYLCEYL
ncbi:MAG: pyrimidine/purine nucleoside phosphorylase [Vibrio sp.]